MALQKPRVNVSVTPEQHQLLLELASLDPTVRSASAFLAALLDQVTPLLRVTVPAMRRAAEEHQGAAANLHMPLRAALRRASEAVDQLDMLDRDASVATPAPSASEGGRRRRRGARA